MMSDLKEQTDGKWICFAPLPVRELVHLLYNMVCEKKGKFPLSLDKVEDILNRGGHGSIKDSFGNIRELSEDWIDELNLYLWENYRFLCDFIEKNIPQWKVCRLEGTYLPWIDISAMGDTSKALCDRLVKEAKVWINPGSM